MKKNIFLLLFSLLVFITGGFFIVYAYTQDPIKPFTNNDVVIEATCFDFSGRPAACKNSGKMIVTNNDIYTINYRDFSDTLQSKEKEVNWIDKTKPKINRNGQDYNFIPYYCTNRDVTGYVRFIDGLQASRPQNRVSGFVGGTNFTGVYPIAANRYNDRPQVITKSWIFSTNLSQTAQIDDKAGNSSIPKTLTVDWIDKLPPSINGFSVDKKGDSVLRVGQTYPVYFSGSDILSLGANIDRCPNILRSALYYYKDGILDMSISQNPKISRNIRPGENQEDSITFTSNSSYGLILVIGDSAGNTVQRSMGKVPPSGVSNVTINTDLYSGEGNIQNDDGGNSALGDLLGVKIIGLFQGSSKVLAGQEANMTLVQASAIRDAIRKNAYTLIRNRSAGKIGGVKYVIGDYTYNNSDNDYDTLIVKNGNLTIDTDINDQKNRGFIVLDDNLDGTNGNIYIGSGVTDIKGILFGEGRLGQKDNYTGSTLQLRILGTVFTRNTIGGSSNSLGNGQFTLPGGKMTTNEDNAKKYDLNLFRAGNTEWNAPSVPSDIQFENASLVIRYNGENTTNPPPGFSIIQ